MEEVLDIDFSEIQNEEDDSWAFVDSNILESARQELETQKKNQMIIEKRQPKFSLEPITERNDEHKINNPSNEPEDEVKNHTVNDGNKRHNHWEHDGIKPVFDCLYWAKTNFVVDKLIHKNLLSKYKESEMTSLELSIKSKKFENNLATTTFPHLLQSTAVSALHGRSSSIQNKNDACKFYSLSNSVAKIKFEKQNTFDGKNDKPTYDIL